MSDDDLDPATIAANQEGNDLDSIKDFGGKTIDDPTVTHVRGKEEVDDDKIVETDEEKEERLRAEAELDDDNFEEKYEDIAKVWTRPTVKELTTKYPNLFKNFPDLRTVMFREAKFTEIFPTLEEATDASVAQSDLETINQRIASGDVAAMLEDLEKEELPKVATNFLPALYKKDKNLYHKIMDPIVDRVLKNAYAEGERTDNDNLKFGAAHLAKYIFGDENFASGGKAVPELQFKADEKLEEERANFRIEKFNEARDAVITYSLKRLENEIKSGLPKDISQRLSTIIIDQVVTEIDSALKKDDGHINLMKRLWKQAEKGNFSGEHKARISSAYLARARNMVPKLRQNILNELVGESDETSRPQRRLQPSGSPPSNNGRQEVTSKNIQYEKSGDLDIIQGKATLKK
jgi:hypothetical protein